MTNQIPLELQLNNTLKSLEKKGFKNFKVEVILKSIKDDEEGIVAFTYSDGLVEVLKKMKLI